MLGILFAPIHALAVLQGWLRARAQRAQAAFQAELAALHEANWEWDGEIR